MSTTIYVWPSGAYLTSEDSTEEFEQMIAYLGDDYATLIRDDEPTLEEVELIVQIYLYG